MELDVKANGRVRKQIFLGASDGIPM